MGGCYKQWLMVNCAVGLGPLFFTLISILTWYKGFFVADPGQGGDYQLYRGIEIG